MNCSIKTYFEELSKDEMKLVLEQRVLKFLGRFLGEAITYEKLSNMQAASQEICNPDFECILSLYDANIDISIMERNKLKSITSEHFKLRSY